jgi:hypothetical protein
VRVTLVSLRSVYQPSASLEDDAAALAVSGVAQRCFGAMRQLLMTQEKASSTSRQSGLPDELESGSADQVRETCRWIRVLA